MAKGVHFFQSIFDSLLGSSNPDAIKKRQLKNITKELAKTKFHFYKAGNNGADPSLAKFLYDIYKVISPAQAMFQNANPAMLKKLVLNAALTEKQHEQLDNLSEEAITSQAKNANLKELRKKIQQDFSAFSGAFDGNRIRAIDGLYTKLVLFSNFCKYDFYFILKKFDNTLRERDFNSPPHFQQINAAYVVEDLKNFIAVAWALPLDAEWDDLFQLLKKFKGVEPVPLGAWKKVVARLRTVHDRGVFEMLIQLITEDPSYRESVKQEDFQIMDEYLSSIRKQVDETLEKLKSEQAASKIDGLLKQVFGTTDIDSLRNYNEGNSAAYERKGLPGFLYCAPLSYLRQFLLDYTKRDMREISDILLVRGEWATQTLAAPMSEAYHQLTESVEKISRLDEKLQETGEYGMKLKTLTPRSDRDKEARSIVNTVLEDVNYDAADLIVGATKNYVIYARNLKMALEDFAKVPHNELIVNWRDLDHFAEGNLKQMCVEAYKKIYVFVSLLQNFQIAVRGTEE